MCQKLSKRRYRISVDICYVSSFLFRSLSFCMLFVELLRIQQYSFTRLSARRIKCNFFNCTFNFRKRKHARDSDWMSKSYVTPDGDYVYARNETPDTVEASSTDNVPRRPGTRLRSPYESIHMEDANAFNVNDVTSAAMLNADRQRTQSPAPAGNTDQDIADLYAVPMKKKKRQEAAPTPETSPADNTEIEHLENDLYQGERYDNEEIVDDTEQDVADLYAVPMKKKNRAEEAQTPVDDTEIEHQENDLYQSYDNEEVVDEEMIVVDNDLYDQCSVVL